VTAPEFDHRGCRAVLCMLAAFWIAVAMGIAAAFDFNVWQWAETALLMGE
jgi:hypothetical protein